MTFALRNFLILRKHASNLRPSIHRAKKHVCYLFTNLNLSLFAKNFGLVIQTGCSPGRIRKVPQMVPTRPHSKKALSLLDQPILTGWLGSRPWSIKEGYA